jgi:hypothetical protein
MQPKKSHFFPKKEDKKNKAIRKRLKILLYFLTGAGFLRLFGLHKLLNDILPDVQPLTSASVPSPQKGTKTKKKAMSGCLIAVIVVLALLLIGFSICALSFKWI